MPNQKITLIQLANWLAEESRPANTLSLEQLFGFLFAINCTPNKLKDRDWMPAVFADQLQLISNDDDYLTAIIEIKKHISQDISDFMVQLPKNCQLTEPFEANFNENALHLWSKGFELGLTLTQHFWDDYITDAQPQSFWMMLSFFSNLHNAQQLTSRFQGGALPIEAVTRHIFSEMNKLMQNYADLAKKYQLESKPTKINISSGLVKNSAGIPIMGQSQPGKDSSQLIQQAWSTDNPVEKVQLAHQALDQDPSNVNALMLLAQWEAANAQQRRDLLNRAVNGCEKLLGDAFFKKNSGRFWLIRETRTFMEALTNLASTYAHLKDFKNAIACYERAIVLNPADNQFNRYPLSNCYIQSQQLNKARQLAQQFQHDSSAFFLFDLALISFIERGDHKESKALKKLALAHNKYTAKVLAGRIKIPKRMPDRLSSGDKDEAVLYAAQNTELWRGVAGSIPWLMKK